MPCRRLGQVSQVLLDHFLRGIRPQPPLRSAGAVETFYRVNRGNTQVIRVEKIEIQRGAQAIVGQVSRG